jgi:hypothetical protein
MATGWDQLPTFVLAKVTNSSLQDIIVTMTGLFQHIANCAGTAVRQLPDKCHHNTLAVAAAVCFGLLPQ